MITDERFDELVKRAGTLASGVIAESARPDVDWTPIYRGILDHLIGNETARETAHYRFLRSEFRKLQKLADAPIREAEQRVEG